MTEFTYEKLRDAKGFGLLKVGDILRWQERRDLIIDECKSLDYPLTGIRRVGSLNERVYFQVVRYKIEPVFKDSLISCFGPTIHQEDSKAYELAERKMSRAGITNETERSALEEDRMIAKASLNLLDILEK
jgi:hypothetical protein